MRYLRMLLNSVIAAGVASAYLTTLVLQLNPAISIDPSTLLPLAAVLGVAYGANLTVAFYALIVLRQILAVEVLSPSDKHEDVTEKVDEYLAVGVAQVWIVDPDFETVTVRCRDREPVLVARSQELSAEPALPGLRVRVAELFE